ncbi:secreted RxLR effector protein 161-like [Actinidia eriantha]|uniref:secreted RxLR effector protein 161-like n=1 Tax=Actinidia eriantha TaxID=165200 RepID=UPI00258A2DDC|nr:secreted RxLR effector protein 161-like [Actinidia eriantha]
MDDKTVDTPLEIHAKLSAPNGVLLKDPTLYRELVGCLVYVTVTRPDISYAVHIVSQYVSALRSTHWAALLRILQYVHGTLHQNLLLSSTSSLILRGYADADWAGDLFERKSTSAFCVFLGNSLHLQSGTIALPFVSTTLQLVDFFTKTHTTARFRFLLDKLSMRSTLAS